MEAAEIVRSSNLCSAPAENQYNLYINRFWLRVSLATWLLFSNWKPHRYFCLVAKINIVKSENFLLMVSFWIANKAIKRYHMPGS